MHDGIQGKTNIHARRFLHLHFHHNILRFWQKFDVIHYNLSNITADTEKFIQLLTSYTM